MTTTFSDFKNDPSLVDPDTITVQRRREVFRSHGDNASVSEEPVRFQAMRGPPHSGSLSVDTRVLVGISDHTEVRMNLDDLLDFVLPLCPPWLLRKKLGL